MSLSEDIKDFALDLGYSRVGITTADGFPEYAAELKARHDMYSFYLDSDLRSQNWAELVAARQSRPWKPACSVKPLKQPGKRAR